MFNIDQIEVDDNEYWLERVPYARSIYSFLEEDFDVRFKGLLSLRGANMWSTSFFCGPPHQIHMLLSRWDLNAPSLDADEITSLPEEEEEMYRSWYIGMIREIQRRHLEEEQEVRELIFQVVQNSKEEERIQKLRSLLKVLQMMKIKGVTLKPFIMIQRVEIKIQDGICLQRIVWGLRENPCWDKTRRRFKNYRVEWYAQVLDFLSESVRTWCAVLNSNEEWTTLQTKDNNKKRHELLCSAPAAIGSTEEEKIEKIALQIKGFMRFKELQVA